MVAPRAGTITELLVSEGDLVAEDQLLFRVVAEETSASGVGSDTAILEAMKQQRSILEDQVRNEAAHNKSETERLQSQVRGLSAEIAQLESQRAIQTERAKNARAFFEESRPTRTGDLSAPTRSRPGCRTRCPKSKASRHSRNA